MFKYKETHKQLNIHTEQTYKQRRNAYKYTEDPLSEFRTAEENHQFEPAVTDRDKQSIGETKANEKKNMKRRKKSSRFEFYHNLN